MADEVPDWSPVLHRAQLEFRGLNEKTRTADFIVATEAPVPMQGVNEVLRMAGADHTRYAANPVVIDSHNLSSIKGILGTGKPEVNGRRMVASIRFDETDEGEAAWKRVLSGSLRATSIGYQVDKKKVRVLRDGETDGEADGTGMGMVKGPAMVCNRWSLHEITMCAVPADAGAVRRSFFEAIGRGVKTMPPIKGEEQPAADAEGSPNASMTKKVEFSDDEKKLVREARITKIRVEQRTAIDSQIRSMAPAALRHVADQLVLEGVDIETARKRLLEEHAKAHKPIGTTEPPPIDDPKTRNANTQVPEMTPDTVLRAITGLRS